MYYRWFLEISIGKWKKIQRRTIKQQWKKQNWRLIPNLSYFLHFCNQKMKPVRRTEIIQAEIGNIIYPFNTFRLHHLRIIPSISVKSSPLVAFFSCYFNLSRVGSFFFVWEQNFNCKLYFVVLSFLELRWKNDTLSRCILIMEYWIQELRVSGQQLK